MDNDEAIQSDRFGYLFFVSDIGEIKHYKEIQSIQLGLQPAMPLTDPSFLLPMESLEDISYFSLNKALLQ